MAAETANEALRDAVIRHQIFLLRYSGSVRNRMLNVLADTEEEVGRRIRDRLANNQGLATGVEMRRMEALVESIGEIRGAAWETANGILTDEMVGLASREPAHLSGIIRTVSPTEIVVALPAPQLLRNIVTRRPFQGRVLREWAAKMRDDDIRQIANQVRMGMIAGEPSPEIARRVIGTARARGADGILELTRRQVNTVVRTAVQHVANEARAEFARENSDIIQSETYVATLDAATTPVCRANDGRQFPVGRGPQPPLHYNCRSTRIPSISPEFGAERPNKPVTERMLVREYAEKNGLGDISSRDKLPRGTKGDFDKFARRRTRELVGPIPASVNYQTWLTGQPTEFQNEVLGVAKAKLFRDGGLTLDKFVHRTGDELTLSELASKHADAFRAAGLDPAKF